MNLRRFFEVAFALILALVLVSCEGLTLPFAKEFKNAVDPVVVQEKLDSLTIPAAPTGLTSTVNDGVVVLSWDEVTGADSYKVYSAEGTAVDETGTALEASKITDLSATVDGLTNGTEYAFVVVAHNAKGDGGASEVYTATPMPGVPGTPLNVVVQRGDASAKVTWTPSAGATVYSVFRSTSTPTAFIRVSDNALHVAEFTDLTVANGTTYWYQVTASNLAGTSEPSEASSVVPQIDPPPAPGTFDTTDGENIDLSWSASSTATSYKVYRSGTAGQRGNLLSTVDSPTTTYSDADVASHATYYYTVTAYNIGGESLSSTQQAGTCLYKNTQLAFDSGYFNATGWGDPGSPEYTAEVLVLFNASSLSPYLGGTITSIDVYCPGVAEVSQYTLEMFVAGSPAPAKGTSLFTATPTLVANQWNTVPLDVPVAIGSTTSVLAGYTTPFINYPLAFDSSTSGSHSYWGGNLQTRNYLVRLGIRF